MTNGASQGLFVIVAVVIFGIFVVISYLLFRDKLQTGLTSIFGDSIEESQDKLEGIINLKDSNKQSNADYYFGYVNLGGDNSNMYLNYFEAKATGEVYAVAVYTKNASDEYVQDTSGEKLTGYLELPDKINGKKIVGLGTGAGSQEGIWTLQNAQITSVRLPKFLKTIPTGLFNNATKLTTIVNGLPEGLTSIGINAFTNAPLTGTIKLPETLTEIKDNAFNRASFTGTLTIPSSMKSIGSSSFANSSFDNVVNNSTSLTLGNSSIKTKSGAFWTK